MTVHFALKISRHHDVAAKRLLRTFRFSV